MQIKDKVAVITGGASGLGRATAELIIEAGGKVAILDLNEELAQKTADELGDSAAPFAANVTEEDSVKAAVDGALEKFGAIHINVNCAGIGAASGPTGAPSPPRAQEDHRSPTRPRLSSCAWPRRTAGVPGRSRPSSRSSESR